MRERVPNHFVQIYTFDSRLHDLQVKLESSTLLELTQIACLSTFSSFRSHSLVFAFLCSIGLEVITSDKNL